MALMPSVACALLMLLAYHSPALGQGEPWGQTALPAPRIYHSLVYVEPLGGLLLTGGHSKLGWEADLRDMWLWRTAEQQWSPLGTYEASPEPSETAGGEEAQGPAYDEESQMLIALNSYGETWALDVVNLAWTKLNPQETPTTRCGQGMAYDAESDRIILFGGFGCTTPNDPALSETWAFDFESGQWTEMHPSRSPSPRMYFSMAYDSGLDRIVLWGGRTLDPIADRAVWLYDFDHDQWEPIEADGGPASVLAYPGMVYRRDSHDFILFGGAVLKGPFEGDVTDETWRLDLHARSWERLSPLESPPGVAVHAMAYDPAAQVAVVFGGEIGRMYSQEILPTTWVYDGRSGVWNQVHSR